MTQGSLPLNGVLWGALALALVAASAARGEDQLLLELETFTSKSGLVTLTRPSAEWAFLDLDVQRREAALVLPPGQLTRAFRGVVARVHHPGMRATLSVYVVRARPEPDLEALVTRAREAAAGASGKVKALNRGKVSGLTGVQIDYVVTLEGVPGQPDGESWIRRLECALPGRDQVVVFVFEVPVDNWRSAKREHKKLLKKARLSSPGPAPGETGAR